MNDKKRTRSLTIKEITLIGLMTAITCILAPLSIPIPISVVPISFTNLAIFFTVFILGWKKGTISYLVYLLIGLAGVPVFSGFGAGIGKLFGPTGGYLFGFILMAMMAGFMIERFPGKRLMHLIGLVSGQAVAYVLGTIWLSFQLNLSLKEGLFMAVIPYLPGDALKIAAAVLVGPVLRNNLRKALNN